ncbi:glycosyltransferase [Staphylococcus xylosus]|uniref:bifunctional glycosyltransferase/CDP-glycerol:glycerophosphate glycerophosphotransferase n=1 Tax=Staphylococcus xylosus TaxID=1288 RepID=UPI000E676DBA|nr:CDP-glycerol glycerophosphotransferase family protein [Staphylococcus xylosus]RIM85672.1 glycosyltransferase [Staphylococcus xylosus]
MNLLIYGCFSDKKEVLEIIKKECESKQYNKIVLANESKSNIIFDNSFINKIGIDLYLVYENINELEVFINQNFKILSLNEYKNMYEFKMSIIIPVYNTEDYIQETMNSILNQTMELKDIQIILINDGSTDNSHILLSKYKKRYPQNIKYINKVNEGVSKARNIGLKYAKGKYINFIDSDDKWGLTTLKNVYEYFEKNPFLDIISTRLRFFDEREGEHPLNYKYENKVNKIVDLNIQYDHIQMNVSSVFFRSTSIQGLKFDTTLKYAEDAKFVYYVIKQKYKIGLMAYTQGCYWYRKRKDETSVIDNALSQERFYHETLDKFHMYLVDDCDYKLPKYVQMMIIYDLQYRLTYHNITISLFDDIRLQSYTERIIYLLKLMDDDVIVNPHLKNINAVYQIAILAVKYKGVNFEIKFEDGIYKVFSNNMFIKNVRDMYLKTEYMYLKKGTLQCGYSLPNINVNITVEPIMLINKREVVRPRKENVITEQKFLNQNISYNKFYRFDLNINKDIKTIEIKYLISNSDIEEIKVVSSTDKTNFALDKTPYKNFSNRSLTVFENKVIKNTRKKRIKVFNNTVKLLVNSNTRKSAIYKTIGLILKKIKRKNVWLFNDRLEQAGDNAVALFDYVTKHQSDIKTYFLINSASDDYNKLKNKYGDRVVAFHSYKHHLLMFIADYFYSSHSEDYLNNPFGKTNGKYIRELLDHEFVFLQHGVIQNDLSSLLHKRNKPMDYFITSSEYEKIEILEKYGYTENEVILSGLARFDLLNKNHNSKVKVITIMPTWRPNLLNMSDEEFLNSSFYLAYSTFFNSEKLLDLIKVSNIQILFCLHPRMQNRFSKFFEDFKFIKIPKTIIYSEIINTTTILITDVSSVAFDIAYINKPVLYYHFDIDDIYKYAAYKPGYFDYLTMGFGPVVNNHAELINEILTIISNDYKTSSIYLMRIEKFFNNKDCNNRLRTISMIEKYNNN